MSMSMLGTHQIQHVEQPPMLITVANIKRCTLLTLITSVVRFTKIAGTEPTYGELDVVQNQYQCLL